MREIDFYKVSKNSLVRTAIKRMNEGGIGFITCVDKNDNVIGILTDGDFRRAILRGTDLQCKTSEIVNRNFYFLEFGYEDRKAKDIFENTVAQHIPILKSGKLVDILIKEEFLKTEKEGILRKPQLNLPVVIMAGGRGTRLDPFTRILPKLLIPIGEKPIVEIIMDRFAAYGMKNFYITVNHKAKMIKAFFEDFQSDYKISFIDEDKPLGTAGSLKYLEEIFDTPFFVSNCDIIIKDDYSKIYEFHKSGNFDFTLVASTYHHTIPYGVCEIKNRGSLKEMKEKPEYDFLVNTGMYILNCDTLQFIPKKKAFDITDLIRSLKESGKKIGVYPVSEKSWIHIGKWEEYKEIVNRLKL